MMYIQYISQIIMAIWVTSEMVCLCTGHKCKNAIADIWNGKLHFHESQSFLFYIQVKKWMTNELITIHSSSLLVQQKCNFCMWKYCIFVMSVKMIRQDILNQHIQLVNTDSLRGSLYWVRAVAPACSPSHVHTPNPHNISNTLAWLLWRCRRPRQRGHDKSVTSS